MNSIFYSLNTHLDPIASLMEAKSVQSNHWPFIGICGRRRHNVTDGEMKCLGQPMTRTLIYLLQQSVDSIGSKIIHFVKLQSNS